jgi:Holliday junction resolvasome RuvABC endonuclease subunit
MIAGIDLSLSSTGLALITDNLKLVKSEAIKTTAAEHWTDRVERIKMGVLRYALESENENVYMENYAFGSVFNREVLGELGGVVREILEKHDFKIIKFAPTKVKMFATGKGAAPPCPVGEAKTTWTKKWVKENVKQNFNGQAFNTDDETDAFVIAALGRTVEMARNNPNILDLLPSYQKKVVQKIFEEEDKHGRKNRSKSGSREQSGECRRSNRKKSARG